jgi:short-subunit dehydrogenase
MTLNPMDLSGKRILVTGASSGIGRHSAIIFSRLGAKLVLTGRNPKRLNQTFGALEGEGHGEYVFDLSQTDEIPRFMKIIAGEQGHFSGLFHSAGVGGIKAINILKEKDIEFIFLAA